MALPDGRQTTFSNLFTQSTGKGRSTIRHYNLRRAITIDNGNWFTLIDSPLAITLWAIAIAGFLLPLIVGRRVKSGMRRRGDDEGSIRD